MGPEEEVAEASLGWGTGASNRQAAGKVSSQGSSGLEVCAKRQVWFPQRKAKSRSWPSGCYGFGAGAVVKCSSACQAVPV